MEQDLDTLRQYFDGDESAMPALEQLRDLSRKYPYFAAPVAAMLRGYAGELDEAEADALRNRLALLTGDNLTAHNAAAPAPDFYPRTRVHKPNTSDALDIFFEKFGNSDPQEDALLEKLIFNPVPDYLDLTGNDDGTPCSLAEAAAEIGSATSTPAPSSTPSSPSPSSPTSTPSSPSAPAKPSPNDSLLSESLAKIFIKQGRYERAYEIISNLNLNYPEKSVYFADQLRFLRKLIILQQHNAKSQGTER